MPNVLGSLIGLLGGPLGILPGTILGVDTGLIGNALGLGPKHDKPETASTSVKQPRPPRVSAYGQSRLYGAYALYETSSNGTAVDVFAVHDGEMDGLVGFYLNDDTITLAGNTVQAGADGRYGGSKLKVYWTTGANPGTAISAITSLVPSIWSSAHRGDGVVIMALTCATVKAEDFLKIYPNGVPTLSMVARWQRCPDPAAVDPTDESGWTWTENSIRQLLHYKLVREGVDYATKIEPAIASWIAASAVCDEAVSLKAGGTEARWRSGLSHKHTDAHKAVTAALLATCDGWIAPRSDGAFAVYAGKYYEPTVTIGPSEIVSFEWDGVGVDDDSAVNEIVCSYVSTAHAYNSVEADPWTDEDDIADRGQVLSTTLEQQVPSNGQIRRLAKRQMARTNAIHRGTVTTNRAGRIVRGERYIALQIIDAGTTFFDGVAEITALTRNVETGGVTFAWVAADPNVDAWNPATEEGDPAAVGDRIAPAPLDTPEIDGLVLSHLDDSGDDSAGARIEITVLGPDRDDLTWFARWRVVGGAIWNEQTYSDIAPGPSVVLLSGFVPVIASIVVEAAYGVGDGRVSDWSAASTITTTVSVMLTEDGEVMAAEDDVLMIEE